MKYEALDIKGVMLMSPHHYRDERGVFWEAFRQNEFVEHCGEYSFVQENLSISDANVIRGLHIQRVNSQGKLIQVLNGKIFDVIVDLREHSHTFGKWLSVELSSENNQLLWVPPGLAHGFYSYTKNTILAYKCTEYYAPEHEVVLMWNDANLSINWPEADESRLKISEKDKCGQSFSKIIESI